MNMLRSDFPEIYTRKGVIRNMMRGTKRAVFIENMRRNYHSMNPVFPPKEGEQRFAVYKQVDEYRTIEVIIPFPEDYMELCEKIPYDMLSFRNHKIDENGNILPF